METLNLQSFGETEKYIVGKYDLEVLCLPRLNINDVAVSQDSTTSVEIPQPEIAILQMSANGYGSVYQEEDNNESKWIYNLKGTSTQESLNLLPGKYRVVFRTKFTTHSVYTIEKTFKVTSAATITVKLY